MTLLNGSPGNDFLQASDNTDHIISGHAGNDTLIGGAGNDYLDGGAGNDIVDGGGGGDTIIWEGIHPFSGIWPIDSYEGGAGYDRLIVGSGDTEVGVRSFDLSEHGFELAEVRGGRFTDYYVDGWIRFAQHLYDSQGRIWETLVYDYAGSFNWSVYRQSFTSSGALSWQDTYQDDGSRILEVYDTANSADWAKYTDFFESSGNGGRLQARQTINDAGSYQSTFFDLTNQNWSHYTDFHTSTGALQARQAVFDDNSYQSTFFDYAKQNSWAQYTDYFNSAGQFLGRSGINDDGTLF